MKRPSSRLIRYTRAWTLGPDDVIEEEITLDRGGTPVPATIVRPRRMRGPLPSWVVLHGITRPGRAHQQLVRFTRSVASAGLAAIVPDVPEWRELEMAPYLTAPTVRAAIDGLRDTGLAQGDRLGLVGFSFGAPHAVASLGDPVVRDDIAGVCGFGGYCSIEHTIRFMMSGRHEWQNKEYTLRPDPYGRWIVAANYLTRIPGREDAGDVADALRALAKLAGDVGEASWSPVYDPEIRRLRASIAEDRRSLFDLFARVSSEDARRHRGAAPRAAGSPREEERMALGEALALAARTRDPSIDPTDAFGTVEGEVHILHGRRDHLIPFTEALRLDQVVERARSRLTVTRLFGHSAQERLELGALADIPGFSKALHDVLTLV
ncbi:MAG: hypothetical protein OEN56_08375 [Gemmatimonadota bacterium]|nr:hypothetical protein [Gemmatimonadota bacterium]